MSTIKRWFGENVNDDDIYDDVFRWLYGSGFDHGNSGRPTWKN